MSGFKEHHCYQCRMPIMVASHDISERNYCQNCAYSKINAVRIPYITDEDD